jgi:ferritin-like protein
VVGKRFAKKQQIQWSKAGAHLLLQTRIQTLDGTLPEMFRKWYPAMAANDAQTPAGGAQPLSAQL